MPDSAAAPGQHVWYVQAAQVLKVASHPFLPARQACCFLPVQLLHSVFVSSTGLKDITAHTESLTKFTQEALSYINKACAY